MPYRHLVSYNNRWTFEEYVIYENTYFVLVDAVCFSRLGFFPTSEPIETFACSAQLWLLEDSWLKTSGYCVRDRLRFYH